MCLCMCYMHVNMHNMHTHMRVLVHEHVYDESDLPTSGHLAMCKYPSRTLHVGAFIAKATSMMLSSTYQ